MQPDKAVGGLNGCLGLEVAVVRINQFQLGLLRVAAEGKSRLQQLQCAHRHVEVPVAQIALGFLVQLVLGRVRARGQVQLVVARTGHQRSREGYYQSCTKPASGAQEP